MMLVNVLLLAIIGGSSAFFFGHGPAWDGLRVTWGPNPLSSTYFASMPRYYRDALEQGFKKISDCNETANWRGARYVKDDDYSLILLYDIKGYIAGIQTMVPPGQPGGYPKANIQPPFVKDGDNFVLTAYFVDPAIICTTGRSKEDFADQGTGTNLYIQNGTVAEKDSILIPKNQADIKNTKWTEGQCFWTMGKHYWYNTSEDMNCDNFFPVFLLYNNKKLNAFGWAMGTNLPSKHLEHPPAASLKYFFKKVPTCLKDKPRSTMHIFLTDSIIHNLC